VRPYALSSTAQDVAALNAARKAGDETLREQGQVRAGHQA